MEDGQNTSVLVQYIGIFLIVAITLGAPVWFVLTLIDMVKEILIVSPTVIFERGAYYSLGAGIGMGAIAAAMLLEAWTKKPLSTKATKIFTRTAIGGVALMFLLPVIAENVTENYLSEKGYGYCDVPSSSWAIYKDVNYTLDAETCSTIIEEYTNRFLSLYSKDDEPVSTLH